MTRKQGKKEARTNIKKLTVTPLVTVVVTVFVTIKTAVALGLRQEIFHRHNCHRVFCPYSAFCSYINILFFCDSCDSNIIMADYCGFYCHKNRHKHCHTIVTSLRGIV